MTAAATTLKRGRWRSVSTHSEDEGSDAATARALSRAPDPPDDQSDPQTASQIRASLQGIASALAAHMHAGWDGPAWLARLDSAADVASLASATVAFEDFIDLDYPSAGPLADPAAWASRVWAAAAAGSAARLAAAVADLGVEAAAAAEEEEERGGPPPPPPPAPPPPKKSKSRSGRHKTKAEREAAAALAEAAVGEPPLEPTTPARRGPASPATPSLHHHPPIPPGAGRWPQARLTGTAAILVHCLVGAGATHRAAAIPRKALREAAISHAARDTGLLDHCLKAAVDVPVVVGGGGGGGEAAFIIRRTHSPGTGELVFWLERGGGGEARAAGGREGREGAVAVEVEGEGRAPAATVPPPPAQVDVALAVPVTAPQQRGLVATPPPPLPPPPPAADSFYSLAARVAALERGLVAVAEVNAGRFEAVCASLNRLGGDLGAIRAGVDADAAVEEEEDG